MVWVCFACVLFILPQVVPVTYQASVSGSGSASGMQVFVVSFLDYSWL
jgi:hypothetical protein